jgi:hypothetical protein
MPEPPLKVLSITGWCRNGSTILGNVLNEVDGFFHVGELHFLWKNAFGRGSNSSCGCGAPLRDCTIWSRVLSGETPPERSGEWHASSVVRRQQATVRTRHTWRVLREGASNVELDAYGASMARAYRTVAEVTGCRVVVDSGKMPAEAALLSRLDGVAPFYLHLVRDPRATAHSWASQKDYIHAMPAWRSTAYWVGFNLASHMVTRRYADRALFLRYEDFIADPARTIDAVLQHCGENPAANPMRGRAVHLGPNHTVTGNPDRFRSGETLIRDRDDAWRAQLSARDRVVATALSWPLRRRYGYRRDAGASPRGRG